MRVVDYNVNRWYFGLFLKLSVSLQPILNSWNSYQFVVCANRLELITSNYLRDSNLFCYNPVLNFQLSLFFSFLFSLFLLLSLFFVLNHLNLSVNGCTTLSNLQCWCTLGIICEWSYYQSENCPRTQINLKWLNLSLNCLTTLPNLKW